MNGRSGQKQHGTDIIAQQGKIFYSFQCKQKGINKKLTEKEIDEEIEKAKQFVPALSKLFIVTTAVTDTKTLEIVRKKSLENIELDLFEISLESWEDLTKRLEDHKDVLRKYYNDLLHPQYQGQTSENQISIDEYGIEVKTNNYNIHCLLYSNNSLLESSCRIIFYMPGEIEVLLEHDDIVKYFFGRKNYFDDICLSYRFVRGESSNKQVYHCLFGNLSISLNKTVVIKLAEAFQAILNLYVQRGLGLEKQYELNCFSIQYERVPLVTIERSLWKKILDFSSQNDVFDGKKGPWGMFDSGPPYLKIYTKGHPIYKDGYHAFIYPGIDEKTYRSFVLMDTEVMLYLELDNLFSSTTGISQEGDWWGARKVHSWLIKDLIPAIATPKEQMSVYSHFNEYRDKLNDDENSLEYLILLIEQLQSFYHTAGFTELDHLESLKIFEVLKLLLPFMFEENISYILSKLSWINATTKDGLIDELNNIIRTSSFKNLTSGHLDPVFGVMSSILRRADCNLKPRDISKIKKDFAEVIRIFEAHSFLERQKDRLKIN
jgi:Holliday junction resolvase